VIFLGNGIKLLVVLQLHTVGELEMLTAVANVHYILKNKLKVKATAKLTVSL
jgi:hypothetical protein